MAEYPFLRELFPTLPAFFAAGAESVHPSAPVATESASPALQPAVASAVADAKLHLKGFLYVSQPAWKALIEGPPLTEALQIYLHERQRLRSGEADEAALVNTLLRVGAEIINPILQSVPEPQRSAWAFYLQVGSPNFDYRSMLLDGEVAALISDWTSLYAFFDFMLLLGQVEWTDNQASFDALVPPPCRFRRRIGRWIRLGL
jgi:phosphatidylserine/phosphatidylglycerophosphate/cardiolipin synthase-like enzyme